MTSFSGGRSKIAGGDNDKGVIVLIENPLKSEK